MIKKILFVLFLFFSIFINNSYADDFLFIWGDTKTLSKYDLNLNKISNSSVWQNIYSSFVYWDYVYFWGSNFLRKYRISDFSLVANISYPGVVYDIIWFSDHIYVVGSANDYKIKQYDLNLNLINESLSYSSGSVRSIIYINNFFYLWFSNWIIKKYRTDLTLYWESSVWYWNQINTLSFSNDSIFVFWNSGRLKKYDLNLNLLLDVFPFSWVVYSSFVYWNSIFLSQWTILRQYSFDFDFISSVDYGSTLIKLLVYKNYIYIWGASGVPKKYDLNLNLVSTWVSFWNVIWTMSINQIEYPNKIWICEDYTSSIPTLINQQKYNLQWQVFTNSWFIQNESSWKKIWWFWFNKNSNWTWSFLNYFVNNLDNFSDVKFYNSSDIEETSTGWILSTFTNSWYLMLENYFFAKGTLNDPAIYLNTFNKFQKINVKSTDVYAYRLYRKVNDDWTLILKNCVTNTPCDISHVSSSLWYDSYNEIIIVPFSTAGFIKFTDYKINDIEIYSYDMEYLTYPVCFYDNGSIDVNWEEFTQEEWEEYKETEIKNGEEKETSFCSALGLLDYIKNPVCWMTGIDEFFKKNVYNTQFFVYFKNFTQFFTIVLRSEDLTYEFKFIWANLEIETISFQFRKNDLELVNYLEDKYDPTFEEGTWKIIQWIIFFASCLAVWFFILWFLFLKNL